MNKTIEAPPARAGEEKKNRRKKWIIGILIAVILLITALFILWKLGYIGAKDPLTEAGVIIGAGVKEGRLEIGGEVEEEEEEAASGDKSQMRVRLNSRIAFADGESEGEFNIINSESNALSMSVEITLEDTGEVIYESGLIPPNHYIDNDKLTKVLEKGEYKATAHVKLIDPDNPDSQFNSANFNLTIVIEN